MDISIAFVRNANWSTHNFVIDYFLSNELLLYIIIIHTLLVLIFISQLCIIITIIILAVNNPNNRVASSIVVCYNCIKYLKGRNNVKTQRFMTKVKVS